MPVSVVWTTHAPPSPATAPPQGPNNKEGIPPAAKTSPRSLGEPVSSRTSQPIAVCCKKVPLAETTWPPKYRRNDRDRRARNELPPLVLVAPASAPG